MTVRIVPSAQYPTIQSAVDASSPGDTVKVLKGIFEESVIITGNRDRLAIVGRGQSKSILKGNNTLSSGFTINGPQHVTIEGFTVREFPMHGIYVQASFDSVINNVSTERNNDDGIRMDGFSRLLIENVVSKQNESDGIHINGGTNSYILDSKCIHNNQNGIYFTFNDETDSSAEDNFISRNIISRNGQHGINDEGSGNAFVRNRVTDNKEDGFQVSNTTRNLYLSNVVEGNKNNGFHIDINSRFLRNLIKNNGANGILVDDLDSGNIIDYNYIRDNQDVGIFLDSTTRNNAVRRNLLENNDPDILAVPPADVNNVIDQNDVD